MPCLSSLTLDNPIAITTLPQTQKVITQTWQTYSSFASIAYMSYIHTYPLILWTSYETVTASSVFYLHYWSYFAILYVSYKFLETAMDMVKTLLVGTLKVLSALVVFVLKAVFGAICSGDEPQKQDGARGYYDAANDELTPYDGKGQFIKY